MRTGFPFPKLTLKIGDQTLSLEGSCRLVDIRIQQRLSLPALCALTFLDPKDELCKHHNLSLGKPLELLVAEMPSEPLFQGELTTVEYIYSPSQVHGVSVRAYDRLHNLQRSQRIDTYEEVTVSKLAQALVPDNISVENDADPGPTWPRLVQSEESDLEFLHQTGARAGRYFCLRQDGLHIMDLAGTGQPALESPLILGKSLLEARIEENSRFSWQSVAAQAWNPLKVETCESGPQRHQQNRIPQADARLSQCRTSERVLADVVVYDNSQAEAIARAELERLAAREVSLWGVAEGDPKLQPGKLIKVEGIASEIAGQYVLTAVNHLINPELGYVSEISTMPPDPPISAGTLMTWGTVVSIDDQRGRVQVKLPGYRDSQTDWLQVMAPGAGPNKGLMSIPAIGDWVLATFPHGRLEQGLVLGGLYGTHPPPDKAWGIKDGDVVRHVWRTSGGQQIVLDDENQRVQLKNKAGSEVDIAKGKLKIHAEADTDIEAPGQQIVIGGQNIDFERK